MSSSIFDASAVEHQSVPLNRFTVAQPLITALNEQDAGETHDFTNRQSLNVYKMHRGSLAHLGLDAAKIGEIRERTREISFSKKYEQRRTESANVRRSMHLSRMSAIDKSNVNRT